MKWILSIAISLAVLASYNPLYAADAGPKASDGGEAISLDAGVASVETADPTPVQEATDDPLGTVASLVKAVRSGDWRMVAALALALVMLVLGKVRGKVKWFRGDRGGVVLVFFLATAGMLSTTLAAGMDVDLKMGTTALSAGLMAIGGYVGIKKLLWPSDGEDSGSNGA